jgi:hypothetical protein
MGQIVYSEIAAPGEIGVNQSFADQEGDPVHNINGGAICGNWWKGRRRLWKAFPSCSI